MAEVVYNITVSISEEMSERWVEWMRSVHIPDMLATNLFSSIRLMRVHAFEQGGHTFAVQCTCRSMEDYERYRAEFSAKLQAQSQAIFKDHVHAFRTLLEVISTHVHE